MPTAKDGPEDVAALFPLVDILNHRPLTKITWAPTLSTFSLVAGEDIPTGVEIFNNYGPKSNEER